MEGVPVKCNLKVRGKTQRVICLQIIWLRFDPCVTLIVDKQVILDVFVCSIDEYF